MVEALPGLSRSERRELAERALEMNWTEAEREGIEFSDACAEEMFRMSDATEAANDAGR